MAKRYASYNEGIGKDIHEGKITPESLAAYADDLKGVMPICDSRERSESVLNRILFSGA